MPEEIQQPEQPNPELNKTVPGGEYIVDGKKVDAWGNEIKASKTTEADEPETAESLAKGSTRDELNKRAKASGLDGNSYTNKPELAAAILEAESKK